MANNVLFERCDAICGGMDFYRYDRSELKYTGVWQEDGEGSIVSYATVSWFDFGFGGEIFAIDAVSDGEVLLILDGAAELSVVFEGMTFFRVSPGQHILRMRVRSRSKIKIKGVAVSESEKLERVPDRTYIQFIGDSITHRLDGFAMTAPERLGVDYSVLAHCGMSLTEGWGWYRIPEWLTVRPGMETNYFKLERPDETTSFTDYNFKYGRKPDILVIFLGTNDYLDRPEQRDAGNIEAFAERYASFVGKLREHYPECVVYLMKATSDRCCRNKGIDAAYELMRSRFDRIELLDSDRWEVEISDDGTHPTNAGHARLADGVIERLRRDGLV